MPLLSDNPFLNPDEPLPSPLVYVSEDTKWEYKIIACGETELPTEADLNALGADGWELTGTVTAGNQIIFYFKRLA